MKRVPLSTIKSFEDESLPIINTIFGVYGQSINDLSYGCMYQYDSGLTVTLSAINTYTYVTGMSAVSCSGFTFINERELQCNNEGTYLLSWSLSFISQNEFERIEGAIGVDGVEQFCGSAKSVCLTDFDKNLFETSMSSTAIIHLGRGECVSILVANRSGAHDIYVQNASLTLVKIDD